MTSTIAFSTGTLIPIISEQGDGTIAWQFSRTFIGCNVLDFDYKKYQKVGVTVIGISTDSVESHKKFVDKMGIPYVLLSDPESEVSTIMG